MAIVGEQYPFLQYYPVSTEVPIVEQGKGKKKKDHSVVIVLLIIIIVAVIAIAIAFILFWLKWMSYP